MGKITPHLWYDKEAVEAAEFYVSVLPDSKVNSVNTIKDTPSGDTDIVSFDLSGQSFMAISAGPLFKFNPSISFMVLCKTKEEVDDFWGKLSEGGQALMPLDSYPFSARYGWTADRYGLTWQIMMDEQGGSDQRITPMLMFVGDMAGRAEEAFDLYTSVLPNSGKGEVLRWEKGEAGEPGGTIKYGKFNLAGQAFAAMDSAGPHPFAFNEAISLMVSCDSQDEIDRYWEALSAVPESEQCGWLKDKFGVSWQIVPAAMDKMLSSADEEQIARVTQAFLQMKKFDLAELERAYAGA